MANAAAHSDYSKFDPYLFNTAELHPHGKKDFSRNGAIPSMMLDGCNQSSNNKRVKNIFQGTTYLEN
ncbi:hypothetical protein CLOSTMETH_00443 [[Clostridium] methylpentosum DSM 5476]|uniref:Uncharacterized protein n=1 Tax=[Clostridium] methylpentosum DSM 5476 TaxID=537013 RepID=C0E9E5_9FIRM|nr:hypothetical protein CLOSTMETH_00443 [[Clostridium] methylpentosum DSM 5476]